MDNCLKDLTEALKEVDVLTINDEEARQLSGEYSLVKAARKILSFGPKYLIIKKGEHGALLFNNEEVSFCVEKFGTEGIEALTDEAVQQRIQEFVKLVHFDVF